MIGTTTTTWPPELARNRELRDLVSQLPNAGRFTAHLYSWGALAIIALGATFTILGNSAPDPPGNVLVSIGLVAAAGVVRRARRAAHYAAMPYPPLPSMIGGILFGYLCRRGRGRSYMVAKRTTK